MNVNPDKLYAERKKSTEVGKNDGGVWEPKKKLIRGGKDSGSMPQMKIYKYDFPTNGQMAAQPESHTRSMLKAMDNRVDYGKLDKIEVAAVSLPMQPTPAHNNWDRSPVSRAAESPKGNKTGMSSMTRVGH